MSINWQWKDKMGEVTDQNGWTANLYRGNCFMIAVNEFQQDGQNVYTLNWFFADKNHAKNCLGLSKDYTGCYEEYNWQKFKLNTWYKETGEFLQLLAKAKANNITIELYYCDPWKEV